MTKDNEDTQRLDNFITKKVYALRVDRGLTKKKFDNIIGTTQRQLDEHQQATNRIAPRKVFIIAQTFELKSDYFHPVYIKIL